MPRMLLRQSMVSKPVPLVLLTAAAFCRADEGQQSVADLAAIQRALQAVAQKATLGVVAIRSARPITTIWRGDPFSETHNRAFRHYLDRLVISAGTGTIIREDGLILTNEHVIERAEEIIVVLSDGSEHVAAVLGSDPRSDLAVIKIDAAGLQPLELGDLDEVKPGQWAIAIGNPFGMACDGHPSVTVGVVSAVGRSLSRQLDSTETRYYGNLVQTSAQMNPGNSGGPLLNIRGQVIGVATAISTRSGGGESLGFAVPISARTKRIIGKLTAGQRVEYGYLGVTARRPRQTEREAAGAPDSGGVYVAAVDEGGPAAVVGLRAGDILVAIDAVRLRDPDHLIRLVGDRAVGEVIELSYYRAKNCLTSRAEVGPRRIGRLAPSDRVVTYAGLTVGELPRDRRRQHVPKDEGGDLVILEVDPHSSAAEAGLRTGQIIARVGQRHVGTLEDLRRLIRGAKGGLVIETAAGRKALLEQE